MPLRLVIAAETPRRQCKQSYRSRASCVALITGPRLGSVRTRDGLVTGDAICFGYLFVGLKRKNERSKLFELLVFDSLRVSKCLILVGGSLACGFRKDKHTVDTKPFSACDIWLCKTGANGTCRQFHSASP
jgi:hypothetical protein